MVRIVLITTVKIQSCIWVLWFRCGSSPSSFRSVVLNSNTTLKIKSISTSSLSFIPNQSTYQREKLASQKKRLGLPSLQRQVPYGLRSRMPAVQEKSLAVGVGVRGGVTRKRRERSFTRRGYTKPEPKVTHSCPHLSADYAVGSVML